MDFCESHGYNSIDGSKYCALAGEGCPCEEVTRQASNKPDWEAVGIITGFVLLFLIMMVLGVPRLD